MALGAIIARAGEFQPLNIALISWGLAKLSFKAEAAFEAMCDAAVQQIDYFAPQNLVQLLWACGTAGYKHESFLRAAARVAKRTIEQFSSQHQSNFLWACARLNFKEDVELLRVVATAAQRKMHEGSPQHLSNIAWAASQLGPQHFQEQGCEVKRNMPSLDPPSIMMLSDSLYEANFGGGEIMQVLRGQVQRMGNELYEIFTTGLPRGTRGLCGHQELTEYQRRLRNLGLTTFGYEHTTSLFQQLQLCEGQPWQVAEAMAMPGWTTNARRTTVARRYSLRLGSRSLEDPGTIFTSAGDAECRAILATHEMLKKVKEEEGFSDVSGTLAFHTSGVPCLSCVGVAAQFKRHYPKVSFCFTFMNRPLSEREESMTEASAVVPNVALAPKTPRRTRARTDTSRPPPSNGGGVSENYHPGYRTDVPRPPASNEGGMTENYHAGYRTDAFRPPPSNGGGGAVSSPLAGSRADAPRPPPSNGGGAWDNYRPSPCHFLRAMGQCGSCKNCVEGCLPTSWRMQQYQSQREDFENRVKFLETVPLLANQLPRADLPTLAAALVEKRWKPGEFLAKQGDVGRELNILKSGTCAVLRKSRALAESARVRAFVCDDDTSPREERNEEQRIATLHMGDWSGGQALAETRTFRASVVAEEPGVVTLSISREGFEALGLHQRLHFPRRNAMYEGSRAKKAGNVVKRMPGLEHVAGKLTEDEVSFIVRSLSRNANLRSAMDMAKSQDLLRELATKATRLRAPMKQIVVEGGSAAEEGRLSEGRKLRGSKPHLEVQKRPSCSFGNRLVEDFFVVCSGMAEILPSNLRGSRRGSGAEEMVDATSLSNKLIKRAAIDSTRVSFPPRWCDCAKDLLRADHGTPVLNGSKGGLGRRKKGGSMVYLDSGLEETVTKQLSRPKEDMKRFRIQTMHVSGEQLLYVGEQVREIPRPSRLGLLAFKETQEMNEVGRVQAVLDRSRVMVSFPSKGTHIYRSCDLQLAKGEPWHV
eukprot:g6134.t1